MQPPSDRGPQYRYFLILSSSRNTHLLSKSSIVAKDLGSAEQTAVNVLRKRRLVDHYGQLWDRWALMFRPTARGLPRLAAQGTAEGATWSLRHTAAGLRRGHRT